MTDEAVEIPEPEAPMPTGVQTNPMPCKIHLLNGKEFRVADIGAWAYIEQGVFATGRFKEQPQQEKDVVIPYERVDYIELDFPALKRHLAANEEVAKLAVIGDVGANPGT